MASTLGGCAGEAHGASPMEAAIDMATGRTVPVEAAAEPIVAEHARLLADAVQGIPGAGDRARIRIYFAPLASETAHPESVPQSAAVAAPWMMLRREAGSVRIDVLVSDHRMLADAATIAGETPAAPGPLGLDRTLLTSDCLNAFMIAYEEWVAEGRPDPRSKHLRISDECPPPGLLDGLIYAATSAPQNFLAPFDQSFMARVASLRDETLPFYRSLYADLIRVGLRRLDTDTYGAGADWWQAAAARARDAR